MKSPTKEQLRHNLEEAERSNTVMKRILDSKSKEIEEMRKLVEEARRSAEDFGNRASIRVEAIKDIVNAQINIRDMAKDTSIHEDIRKCITVTIAFLDGRESVFNEISKKLNVKGEFPGTATRNQLGK